MEEPKGVIRLDVHTMQNCNNQEREDDMPNLYADYLRQKWKAEIERAIDRIKHPRSEWDKSFRKEWHRAKWRRMRGWSRFARNEQTDLRIG